MIQVFKGSQVLYAYMSDTAKLLVFTIPRLITVCAQKLFSTDDHKENKEIYTGWFSRVTLFLTVAPKIMMYQISSE